MNGWSERMERQQASCDVGCQTSGEARDHAPFRGTYRSMLLTDGLTIRKHRRYRNENRQMWIFNASHLPINFFRETKKCRKLISCFSSTPLPTWPSTCSSGSNVRPCPPCYTARPRQQGHWQFQRTETLWILEFSPCQSQGMQYIDCVSAY